MAVRVKYLLFGGLNLVATVAMAQQPAVPPVSAVIPTVTLPDAISLALRAHPAIVQAQATLTSAHSQKRVALASWLPTANIGSSVSKGPSSRFNSVTGQVVSVPTPYSGSLNFNASWTLFDGGARLFQGRSAGAAEASAEAGLVTQKFSVTLQTKQAFYTAVAAADLERVARTSQQRAEENLKIARSKLAAGSAVRSDTLTATVAVGQAKLSVLSAQTSRANAEATLARLIAFDKPVRAVGDSSVFAVIEFDTAGLRAEAMSNSPAIIQADATLRTQEANVNQARVAYFPTLSAGYSNSRNVATSSFGGAIDYGAMNPSWGLSLGLSFPLFNGLRREQTLWNANANRDAAEASAADSRRNVNALVTQWLAQLTATVTRVSIAQASREAASEALRVQNERYRLGAATIVEVLQAQQQLDQSEVDAVQARTDYQIARAQIEALLGRSL